MKQYGANATDREHVVSILRKFDPATEPSALFVSAVFDVLKTDTTPENKQAKIFGLLMQRMTNKIQGDPKWRQPNEQ